MLGSRQWIQWWEIPHHYLQTGISDQPQFCSNAPNSNDPINSRRTENKSRPLISDAVSLEYTSQ